MWKWIRRHAGNLINFPNFFIEFSVFSVLHGTWMEDKSLTLTQRWCPRRASTLRRPKQFSTYQSRADVSHSLMSPQQDVSFEEKLSFKNFSFFLSFLGYTCVVRSDGGIAKSTGFVEKIPGNSIWTFYSQNEDIFQNQAALLKCIQICCVKQTCRQWVTQRVENVGLAQDRKLRFTQPQLCIGHPVCQGRKGRTVIYGITHFLAKNTRF